MEEEQQQQQNSPRNVSAVTVTRNQKNIHVEKEKECRNSFSLKFYLRNPYI